MRIILSIFFMFYISAYSRDILQNYNRLDDRNVNISLNSIYVRTNDVYDVSSAAGISVEKLPGYIDSAKSLISSKNYFEAIEYLNDLDAKYKNYADIFYLRGIAYLKAGDIAYATRDFEQLLYLYFKDESMYNTVGEFFELINDYELALRTYLLAYKVSKDAKWLSRAGQLALSNGDINGANNYFNMISSSPYGREGIADVLFANKEYTKAIETYSNAMKQFSNSDDDYRVVSKISNTMIQMQLYLWQNNLDRKSYNNAISILDKIVDYSYQYPEITLARAKTYFYMNNYREAKNLLTSFIVQYKAYDEAYALLAQIYLLENNEKAAIELLEKGLRDFYANPRLYELFANILYNIGYSYYPSKLISQIIDIYEVSDENKIEYVKYLINTKKYTEAHNVLAKINSYQATAKGLKDTIEYNKILDKVLILEKSDYYVDIMSLLSKYKFTGYEEQMRVYYIAKSYYKLGSIDKAIDTLKDAFERGDISVNNVLLLRVLLTLRSQDGGTIYESEVDTTYIKATELWEEDLVENTNLVLDKIYEYVRFKQYDEALSYIDAIKTRGFDYSFIKKLQSIVYGYYASNLYEQSKYDLALSVANIAIQRNRENYDAQAIKTDIDIDAYKESVGDYENTDVYVKLSKYRERVLNKAVPYLENYILLAEALVNEYDIKGYEIINKIFPYINKNGGKDVILGRIYNKSRMYSYSIKSYNKAAAYMKIDLLNEIDSLIAARESSTPYYENNALDERDHYALAKLYTYMKRYNDAFKNINTALIFNKNNLDYVYQISYINELVGNVDQALSGYKYIISRNKRHAAANYRAALLSFQVYKNFDDAKNYAFNYIAVTPDDYSGYELLGRIYHIYASSYATINKRTILSDSLTSYKKALNKAVWAKDSKARENILREIDLVSTKIYE